MAGYTLNELMRTEKEAIGESPTLATNRDELIEQIRGMLGTDQNAVKMQSGGPTGNQKMNELRARVGIPPRMFVGGQPPPMPPMPPMPQQQPSSVPAVGGGLPSVADNIRTSMPLSPQGAAPTGGITEAQGMQVDELMAGLDPDSKAGMMGTIEQSESPEEMLPNAMASTVAAVADSREEIIATFDRAKEQALNTFDMMVGADTGMSETDAQRMELLGGGEEMAIADEINMLG